MLYANVYEYDGPLGKQQFTDTYLIKHMRRREDADSAAEWELAMEPNTRRIGVLRIKPRASAE